MASMPPDSASSSETVPLLLRASCSTMARPSPEFPLAPSGSLPEGRGRLPPLFLGHAGAVVDDMNFGLSVARATCRWTPLSLRRRVDGVVDEVVEDLVEVTGDGHRFHRFATGCVQVQVDASLGRQRRPRFVTLRHNGRYVQPLADRLRTLRPSECKQPIDETSEASTSRAVRHHGQRSLAPGRSDRCSPTGDAVRSRAFAAGGWRRRRTAAVR